MNSTDFQEQEVLWGYAKRLRFVRQAIADAFPRRAPDALRILDVGCGNGSQLALPLARVGFRVTGVDIDPESIEHANEMAGELDNAEFVCGGVEQLPAGKLFDVVILSEVLEHTTEPGALLATSVGYLTPDGVVIVTVPNGFGEFEIDSWFFRTLRLQSVIDALAKTKSRRNPGGSPDKQKVISATNNEDSGHVQFFTRRRLRRLFTACGLRIIREGAASLFAGPLAGHTLARSTRFIKWNATVTDTLPYAFASGWYFALRRLNDSALQHDANGNVSRKTTQDRSQA